MRHEFCTLFDVNYLPRAVALYRSLERYSESFTLRAFCMDDPAKELLDRLALPHVIAIGLDELERHDDELLSIKPDRTQVEYCWTATPAVCLHALAREPELAGITYLDADLFFFSSPQLLFDELRDDAVLIVPHRYAPPWRAWEETSGIYNVEWLTFRRDERGLAALRWWRERCIEWCYARYEDGKMGDQKYLDDWPERFEGVHVLQHPGGGLAPWNVTDYALDDRDGQVTVDGLPLVFFHHHSLSLFEGVAPARALAAATDDYRATGRLVWGHGYPLHEPELRLVWEPYLRALDSALAEIREVAPGFAAGIERIERVLLRRAREKGSYVGRRVAGSIQRRLPDAVARRP